MAFAFSSKFPNPMCSIRPRRPQISAVDRREIPIPARDRVVDFGKYKGKMLGALPSSYLKWVSKNLRAGDSMQWAILADQVLQDPIYQDRIEWEFADTVLNGNRNSSCSGRGESAVSQLVEVSERFGWDNEDKIGWSRVNFELLGTSKGGRIPRLEARDGGRSPERRREEKDRVLSAGEMRRKERRERRAKLKKVEERGEKLGIIRKFGEEIVKEGKLEGWDQNLDVKRFGGRESLLNKGAGIYTTANNNIVAWFANAESVLRVAATGHDKRLFFKVVICLYVLSTLGRLVSGFRVAYAVGDSMLGLRKEEYFVWA